MKAERTGRGGRGRSRWFGRPVLFVVATLFTLSAAIKLGAAGALISDEMKAHLPQRTETSSLSEQCETSEDITTVLNALREREAELVVRENALKDRLQALALAEQRTSGQLAALVEAEEKLAETISISETAAADDLAQLTTVYENMKPKQAIPLFETMDPDFAAGFLARMEPGAAATIMAGLDPQAAYAISVILAGRNANAPTN